MDATPVGLPAATWKAIKTQFLRLCVALLAVGAVCVSGCSGGGGGGGDDAEPAVSAQLAYVGAVDGTDALIAIAPEGNLVVAYVCAEETWAAHTGWFYTELENDAQGTGKLKAVTSGTGHSLEGVTITATQATGTVRFADGAVHSFTADRATPGTTAGLYESRSSEGHTGLIVTNDRRAAGAARLLSGTEAAPTVSPVTVTQSLATTTGTGITVTNPNLGGRTLTPVVPVRTGVSRIGPTLYILVHGMNHPVGGAADRVDTPQQSRTEWHLDFIQGLLGGADPNGAAHVPMFNFAGQQVTQGNFVVTQGNFMDPAMLLPFNSFTADEDIEALDRVAAHFITMDNRVGDVRQGGAAAAGRVPLFSAFITYRDAGGGLVESGRRIANETYVALRWYELHFRVTPKVVYVAQSFGGAAARFVLSNPTQALLDAPGPPGSVSMNADRILLSTEDRRRMDFVRDRIMYLVTLGTPHEGSFMADLAVPLQENLLALERSLDNGVAGLQANLQALGTLLGQIGPLAASVVAPRQTAQQTLANVRAGLAEARRQANGRALRDLTHAFWLRVNGSPLHPSRARRTGASPIVGAASQLIPIYATGGRTPGGRAFTAPELAVFDRFQAENSKEQEWMISTIVTDLLIHSAKENQGGFGRSTQGIYAAFDAQLDRRERIIDGSAFARETAASIGNVSPWFAEEFGAGVEGVTRFLMGNARLVALPLYLDRKGSFDLGGSVLLRVPAFQCTLETGQVFRIKLELGQLLTLMRNNFGTLRVAATRLAGGDLNGVVNALTASAGDSAEIVRWFVGEYLALRVPSGRCELGGINLSSPIAAVLSVANILNWTVVDGTDTFPAPRWVFNNQQASDNEIDDDGVVGFESAVGFSLGTQTPLFFDHTRGDAPGGARGSWYRIFDSPVERECHGMQHQWSVGNWTLRNFANAGPVPGAGELSVFP